MTATLLSITSKNFLTSKKKKNSQNVKEGNISVFLLKSNIKLLAPSKLKFSLIYQTVTSSIASLTHHKKHTSYKFNRKQNKTHQNILGLSHHSGLSCCKSPPYCIPCCQSDLWNFQRLLTELQTNDSWSQQPNLAPAVTILSSSKRLCCHL